MRFHRSSRELELNGDLFVGQAAADQVGDLVLADAESCVGVASSAWARVVQRREGMTVSRDAGGPVPGLFDTKILSELAS